MSCICRDMDYSFALHEYTLPRGVPKSTRRLTLAGKPVAPTVLQADGPVPNAAGISATSFRGISYESQRLAEQEVMFKVAEVSF